MEKTNLKKKESSFVLTGRAIVNDYTFDIDKESENSDWVYNRLNLGVDCGQNGTIYCEAMGGYGAQRDNVVYVHGVKEEEGKVKDDFQNRFTIDWDDRLNEDLFDTIGDNCFVTIGIEKNTKGETFYKKFLSEYDAIAYLKEHLTNDTIITVKGKLEFSEYDGYTQKKKIVTSIALSRATQEEEFKAYFTQAVLVDKDSLQRFDRELQAFEIDGYVVDYVGKPFINGRKVEIKNNCAFTFQMVFKPEDVEKGQKFVDKFLKPKKSRDVWEVVVEGVISKGGVSLEDTEVTELPEDLQELVELGILTEDEAIEKVVGKTNNHDTYYFVKPKVRKVDDEVKIFVDKEKYEADDIVTYKQLVAPYLGEEAEDEESSVSDDIGEDDLDLDSLLDEIQ